MPEELRVADNDDREVTQSDLNLFIAQAQLSCFSAMKYKTIK